MFLKNSKFILITFFNKSIHLWFGDVVSDGADWHHIATSQNQKIVKPNTVQCISRPRSTVVYAASVCRVKKWLIEGAIGPQKSGLCYHSELNSIISFKIHITTLWPAAWKKIFDSIHTKVENKGQYYDSYMF